MTLGGRYRMRYTLLPPLRMFSMGIGVTILLVQMGISALLLRMLFILHLITRMRSRRASSSGELILQFSGCMTEEWGKGSVWRTLISSAHRLTLQDTRGRILTLSARLFRSGRVLFRTSTRKLKTLTRLVYLFSIPYITTTLLLKTPTYILTNICLVRA